MEQLGTVFGHVWKRYQNEAKILYQSGTGLWRCRLCTLGVWGGVCAML